MTILAEKGKLLIKGKTKWVHLVKEDPDGKLVICECLNTITAHNDDKFTREFEGKGRDSNIVNQMMFDLLNQAGIPTAFKQRISDTEFLADNCQMIPLEVIARRFLTGSYLKRYPHILDGTRCHRLKIEFFFKTTKGGYKTSAGKVLVSGLTTEQEDPLIEDPYGSSWTLVHPKLPRWHEKSSMANVDCSLNLAKTIFSELGINNADQLTKMREMEELTRRVFLIIEGAWKTLGLRYLDFKIEFGITPDGKLVVADVIDSDSGRMSRPLPGGLWEDVSKQSFRDATDSDNPDELDLIRAKYAWVAEMASRIRVPNQVLVLWRGSDKDKLPEFDFGKNSGVTVEEVVLSGHKATSQVLHRLNELETKYPEGGVILCFVGRSNGLGPILSAHTNWPVISVPATYKSFAEDLHSSVRMPSDTPNLTTWDAGNAVLAALNILAQSNPIAYMLRQLRIEELDS